MAISTKANCESPLDVGEDLDEVVEAEYESAVGPDVQHRVAHSLVGGVREVDDAQVNDVIIVPLLAVGVIVSPVAPAVAVSVVGDEERAGVEAEGVQLAEDPLQFGQALHEPVQDIDPDRVGTSEDRILSSLILDHQGCHMAKFDLFLSLDCARVEGVGAPGWRVWGRNSRMGRDQILLRSVAEP